MRMTDTLTSPLDGLPRLPAGSRESSPVIPGELFAEQAKDFFLDARGALTELPIEADAELSHVIDDPNGLSQNLEDEMETGAWTEQLTVRDLGHFASLGFTYNRYILTRSYDGSIPTQTTVQTTTATIRLGSNDGRLAAELSSRDMTWHLTGSELTPDITDLYEIVHILSDATRRLRAAQSEG